MAVELGAGAWTRAQRRANCRSLPMEQVRGFPDVRSTRQKSGARSDIVSRRSHTVRQPINTLLRLLFNTLKAVATSDESGEAEAASDVSLSRRESLALVADAFRSEGCERWRALRAL